MVGHSSVQTPHTIPNIDIDAIVNQPATPIIEPPVAQVDEPDDNNRFRPGWRWVAPLLALLLIVLWQIVVPATGPTALLLPQPSAIGQRLIAVLRDGTLPGALWNTTAEIVLGGFFGVGIAFLLGYGIAHNRTLDQVAGPYIVAFQALPIVAIAPALILWLGPGLLSNSILCALIVFFPMLVSTIVGLKSVTAENQALIYTFGADRWQRFRYLELPSALPTLFGGLRISATLAVAGAVVAESVTPLGGLGSMLYAARSRYDSALAFVAVLMLAAFALTLYGTVSAFERRLLAGRRQPKRQSHSS
jgi:NitT/TauT family transport system permease protein